MTGFSSRSVWKMKRFYTTGSAPELLQQLVAELTPATGRALTPVAGASSRTGEELVAGVRWGHHVLLLGKIKETATLLSYLRETARFGWSRAVLFNQGKANTFKRALAETSFQNAPAIGDLARFAILLARCANDGHGNRW